MKKSIVWYRPKPAKFSVFVRSAMIKIKKKEKRTSFPEIKNVE